MKLVSLINMIPFIVFYCTNTSFDCGQGCKYFLHYFRKMYITLSVVGKIGVQWLLNMIYNYQMISIALCLAFHDTCFCSTVFYFD